MPNICDSKLHRTFSDRLDKCKQASYGVLTSWETNFVDDLSTLLDGREAQLDLGMSPWSPSAHQWNQLAMIAEKC